MPLTNMLDEYLNHPDLTPAEHHVLRTWQCVLRTQQSTDALTSEEHAADERSIGRKTDALTGLRNAGAKHPESLGPQVDELDECARKLGERVDADGGDRTRAAETLGRMVEKAVRDD